VSTLANLAAAGREYSAAAKAVSSKTAIPRQPSAPESELLIALGIASVWVRRAAAMRPISFDGKRLTKSAKSPSISQVVRFSLAWSGMNALFSRDSVFSLLGIAAPRSELDRFKALYASTGIPSTSLTAHLTTLHTLLVKPTLAYIPGHPPGSSHSVLKALHFKYTPVQYQSTGSGKAVTAAIASGNLSALDLPLLIYLMRNWSVHGGFVNSNFRSVRGFDTYIDTVSEAMSIIHLGVAKQLALNA
jgi:hypothetical protein